MASGGGNKRAWVADLEGGLAGAGAASERALWSKHSVHRVPAAVKDLHPHAYRPQVVSLGPFHHGDQRLVPMEPHKLRVVARFVGRRRRPVAEFVAAVEAAAAELEESYQDLAGEWRGERFLQVMFTDGCFLLEMMRTAKVIGGGGGGKHDEASGAVGGYAHNDPVFGRHGAVYMVPYVRRDMLIVENQLPLLLLQKLVAVETGKESQDLGDVEYEVKKMVLRFISPSCKTPPAKEHRALHPLDLFRKSLLSGQHQRPRGDRGSAGAGRDDRRRDDDEEANGGIIRSAAELYEAGIRFRRSPTASLHDITFRRGVLALPFVVVDDSTEYAFLNLMAFERLHAGAGNDVTAYVLFMDSIIDSARDAALLTARGVIQNAVGSDKAVARLFNGLSKDVVALDGAGGDGELYAVRRAVSRYCRKPCHVWRANLVHTYFRSPWAFMSLAAAVFLLAMTVAQTVYTVLPFYQQGGNGGEATYAAPAPR
ncbi:UPF0481 protein At3g47200 [Oryza sativa Japonica Group]|uniref:Uncharacterized protein n=2 Tax=Oryza sativa subsp. japonica TaxID=39947 RepID=A0A8J8YQM4_ORYSJ|nr:UPF0481 protein At3g47200 [Oryza sativa Japonica Group]ABA98257.1 hypothetical protein LOC_Os12g29620 [Oryza sativa Japonica Group]EAZ20480.1 hypothetical protein OsJ_36089 [Oryza sativa Japonica Group]KAF2907810.1 hypothetical protein DAI22_12g128000 [Oryza sativa Japonica Group]